MGRGAPAVLVVPAAPLPGTMPARWSAAEPSATDGIWIVPPRTTLASGESPLAAARVRVVRLLAAAIDQSVSPGPTVWATLAVAAGAAQQVATSEHSRTRRMRRMFDLPCQTNR